jgi:type II secretory pathway pseudopilin PulG
MLINITSLTQKRRQLIAGVTLLELMLVCSIIILGIVIAISQYNKTIFNRNTKQVQNSVRILTDALARYYYANCHDLLSSYKDYSISVTELTPYIASPKIISNPYSVQGLAAYQYSINTINDMPILEVSSTFPNMSQEALSVLEGVLKPTSINKTTFLWNAGLENTSLTPAALNPNISYMNALSAELSTPGKNTIASCAYWQQPKHRCTLTNDLTRCTFKSP